MRAPSSRRAGLEHRLREAIFAHFVAHADAPSVEVLSMTLGASTTDTLRALERLNNPADVVLAPGSAEIWLAHPFAAHGTGYRVTCRGREYWTSCAWDAVGLAAVLGADIEVSAACPDCGEALYAKVRGGVAQGDAIVHVLVPPCSWFQNIAFTCATTLMFRSEPHARRWCEQRHVEFGGVMTLSQALELYGRLSRGGRMAGDWHPPDLADRVAAFSAAGLASGFWTTIPIPDSRMPRSEEDTAIGMTPREIEVLELMAGDYSQKEIARRLGVSRHTVDAHIRNIYGKLHVRSRGAAVAVAVRARLL